MSAVSAIQRGRVAAQALMIDACTVSRVTAKTTDPETGDVVETLATIYTGKCKIQRTSRSTNARPVNLGEAEVLLARLELHLPYSATGILSDDRAHIDASQLDPDLVGLIFFVRELAHKTLATARRFGLLEVTS